MPNGRDYLDEPGVKVATTVVPPLVRVVTGL